jgi:hypothetical protein
VNAVEQLSERSPWVHPWCTAENACRPVSPHSPPRPFRQRLDARGLKWAVGIPKQKKVYPSNVELVFPVAGRGRPRRRPVPHQLSAPAEAVLAKAKWRSVSWRKETKGPLASLFRRQAGADADGSPQRIHDKCSTCQAKRPGWSASAALRASTNTINLPTTSLCEQAHQQLKEELGRPLRRPLMASSSCLDDYDAYAYLQTRRL